MLLYFYSKEEKEMDIDFQEENYETVEDYIKDIIHDHNYVR